MQAVAAAEVPVEAAAAAEVPLEAAAAAVVPVGAAAAAKASPFSSVFRGFRRSHNCLCREAFAGPRSRAAAFDPNG